VQTMSASSVSGAATSEFCGICGTAFHRDPCSLVLGCRTRSTKLSVLISGNILSALIEEASRDTDCVEGLLLGNILSKTFADISDSDEKKVTVSTSIGIVEFLSFRGRAPQSIFDSTVASSTIGVFSVRRDAVNQPSFRDVIAARKLFERRFQLHRPPGYDTQQYYSQRTVVIIIINIPDRSIPSWIMQMQYSGFVINDSNWSPVKIPIEVVSLLPENPFDFKSLTLHSSV